MPTTIKGGITIKKGDVKELFEKAVAAGANITFPYKTAEAAQESKPVEPAPAAGIVMVQAEPTKKAKKARK